MKSRARILGVIVALAGAGLLVGSWKLVTLRRAVVASIPDGPNLAGVSTELVGRLADAEQRAHRLWGGATGAAELARLYHANGFLPQAMRLCLGLMALEPREARWPYFAGVILTGYGQLDEGLPLLRRAAGLAANYAPAHLKLGDASFKNRLLVDAAASYEALLKLEPNNPYALLGLARCDIEEGRWQAASTRLRQAVAEHPGFPAAWTTLAGVCERLGDPAGAATCRNAVKKAGRFREMADPWIDDLMTDCYDVYRIRIAAAAAERPSVARQLLERALALAPTDAALHRQLGSVLVELGEIAVARVHYERAVTIDPDDADNWTYYVQVLRSMGDEAAADSALARGLGRCPNSPSLHYSSGQRFAAVGQLAAAAEQFREARRLRPQEANASVELALIEFKLGHGDRAMEELRSALAAEPEHPFALEVFTKLAIDAGDEPAAREWLHRVRGQPRVAKDTTAALEAEFRERFQRSP